MRKLIYLINATPDGRCDHSAVIPDDEMHRYASSRLELADTVLFGRKSWQLLRQWWPDIARSGDGSPDVVAFARKLDPMPKLVFSSMLGTANWNTEISAGEPGETVRALKRQPGKALLLLGSATLAASLQTQDLIDEYHIVLHPMITGVGPRLFDEHTPKLELSLQSATPFASGAVALCYARKPRS